VARGFEALLTTDGIDNRAYNIGTGTEWTVREVAEKVGEALGRDLDIQQAQERVRESDRPHLRASTERIQREVGWEPEIEFVDGLGKLLDAEGIR
jgi:nucleoside-diphosphate-sugar epimerase